MVVSKFWKKKDYRKKILVWFAVAVGLLFAIELIALPLSYRDVSDDGQNMVNYGKKFEESWIFENLSEEEQYYVLSSGMTLATYHYANSPNNFDLEQIVTELEGQVILNRVSGDDVSLEFESVRGSSTPQNMTLESIFASLCDVLYYPPPDCTSFGTN